MSMILIPILYAGLFKLIYEVFFNDGDNSGNFILIIWGISFYGWWEYYKTTNSYLETIQHLASIGEKPGAFEFGFEQFWVGAFIWAFAQLFVAIIYRFFILNDE
jgi:hypothetical protein